MQVQGKRILIAKPERKESVIEMTEVMKQDLERDLMKKYTKLKVAFVGDECEKVKAGDLVYVGTALEHCEILDIEGKLYFMLNEMQVSIIW